MGRPLLGKKPKDSNRDYPLFAFRLYSQEQKERLDQLVAEALTTRNRKLSARPLTKSELLYEAISIGLRALKKDSKSRK